MSRIKGIAIVCLLLAGCATQVYEDCRSAQEWCMYAITQDEDWKAGEDYAYTALPATLEPPEEGYEAYLISVYWEASALIKEEWFCLIDYESEEERFPYDGIREIDPDLISRQRVV